MLTIDEITSEAQFKALKVEWNTLLEKSGQYSAFLAHEWFQCCFLGHAEGRNIVILIVTDRSGLLGIAPLWQYPDVVRAIPVSRVGFITSPDTPFVDFIIQKERRSEVLKTALQYLYTKKKTIGMC